MTTSVTRLYFTTQHKTCKDQDRFFLVSDRSCPKTDGLRPHHWSGEALWAPQSVGFGRSPDSPRCFTIFSTQNGLSWHYNTVLLWITKRWKILNRFNLESITVHLVMLFDFFRYKRLNSQSERGKWWSSLQRRGEVDRGNSTLGGIPQAVPNLDHMDPGAPEKLGAPVVRETLALYDFWKMQKSQKLEKEYFSYWTDSKRIFGT